MPDLNTLLAGGGLVAAAYALWDWVKAGVWRLTGLGVARVRLPDDLYGPLVWHLMRVGRRLPGSDRRMVSYYFDTSDGHRPTVFNRVAASSQVFLVGRWPVVVRPAGQSGESRNQGPSGRVSIDAPPESGGWVYAARGTVDIDRLVSDAVACRAEASAKSARGGVYRLEPSHLDLEYWSADHQSGPAETEPLEAVSPAPVPVTRPARRQTVPERRMASDAAAWLADRQWYAERGIPWRRGYLLYGPPGSGKTSAARAMAADNRLPLVSVNLARFDDTTLAQAIATHVRPKAPCVLLVDDLDATFHGRENVLPQPDLGMSLADALRPAVAAAGRAASLTGDSGDSGPAEANRRAGRLSFAGLLAAVDGAVPVEGVIWVFTVNDLAMVDPALGGTHGLSTACLPVAGDFVPSGRPGRVDRAVRFGPADPAAKRAIWATVVGGEPPDDLLRQRHTAAVWVELCRERVLADRERARDEARADAMADLVLRGEWECRA